MISKQILEVWEDLLSLDLRQQSPETSGVRIIKNEKMMKLMIMKMMIVFPIFFRFLINFDLPLGISRKIMLKWGHVRWRGIFQEVTTNSRTTRIERDLHIEVEWDDAFRKMPIHLWVVIFREFIQRQWGFRFWY